MRRGRRSSGTTTGAGSWAACPSTRPGRSGRRQRSVPTAGRAPAPRRSGRHAHKIKRAPDNRFAIAADLGLDKLLVSRLNPAEGTLAAHEPAFATVSPGSGPRHFAFDPAGKFVYACNEMAMTVTAFAYD